MDISKVTSISLIAVILILILKNQRPEIALVISIITGVLIFIMTINSIGSVIGVLQSLADRSHVNSEHLKIILKVIGIAYLTQFSASIARDAGQNAISYHIEFAGKIFIVVLSIPIIMALLELIIKIID